jgi:hypothetical protein
VQEHPPELAILVGVGLGISHRAHAVGKGVALQACGKMDGTMNENELFPHECDKPLVSDFTTRDFDLVRIEHYFCHHCRAHMFRGEFFDAQAWEEYVNG